MILFWQTAPNITGHQINSRTEVIRLAAYPATKILCVGRLQSSLVLGAAITTESAVVVFRFVRFERSYVRQVDLRRRGIDGKCINSIAGSGHKRELSREPM